MKFQAAVRGRFSMSSAQQFGFSLIELMVGMTIGLIALLVIGQTLSVFDVHKTTTTAAADAQENGLLALSAIEQDVRRAAAGFNHPSLMRCQNLYSYYQERSGVGAPIAVGTAAPFPVLLDDGAVNDRITIRAASYLEGAVATLLSADMEKTADPALLFKVERGFALQGEPSPARPGEPDLIVVADREAIFDAPTGNNVARCSLMQVSSITADSFGRSIVRVVNGPAGKNPEYNASHAFMENNNWPGFGSRSDAGYKKNDLLFRLGSTASGGVLQTTYQINASGSLEAQISGNQGAASRVEVLASDVVALQAQYGISATPSSQEVALWVNPSGATWGSAALNPAVVTASAIDNRLRIKAVRIAIVARSGMRDGGEVTTPCAENNAPAGSNFGPCAWTDDSAANPAPAIDLRSTPGDTEWQHYRYRVYQTVIPMRNILWPEL
ncbi:MAG: PilW family protein [Propionivibrio sp.]